MLQPFAIKRRSFVDCPLTISDLLPFTLAAFQSLRIRRQLLEFFRKIVVNRGHDDPASNRFTIVSWQARPGSSESQGLLRQIRSHRLGRSGVARAVTTSQPLDVDSKPLGDSFKSVASRESTALEIFSGGRQAPCSRLSSKWLDLYRYSRPAAWSSPIARFGHGLDQSCGKIKILGFGWHAVYAVEIWALWRDGYYRLRNLVSISLKVCEYTLLGSNRDIEEPYPRRIQWGQPSWF